MSESKENLEKLKRRRANYKGQVTAFKGFINDLGAPSSLAQVEAVELQLRIGKFEGLYDKYDEVQLEIECLDEIGESPPTDRTEFESSYYRLLAQAQTILSDFSKQAEEFQPSLTTQIHKQKLVKLPTIQLPKFNGSYENWIGFRDTFSSLIDKVEDIDEINKFHYLRTSLEGSAAVVIQSIEFSAKNYAVAWKLLCERYDNKRLLIQNHISALFNMEAITKESSTSLKRLIDNLNKNLRALESLGEPVKMWDTLLIYIVIHKLDSKTFREWEEYKGRLNQSDLVTLETFVTFLRNQADLIEVLEMSRNAPQTQSNPVIKNSPSPRIKSMISVQQTENSTSKACPQCNAEHSLSTCSEFLKLSNEARLNLLPQFKICFNCFRTGHYANRCKKPGCTICKRKHNSLVHVADFKQIQHTLNQVGSTVRSINDTELPVNATQEAGPSTSVVLSASVSPNHAARGEVLLSTALVKLYDDQSNEYVVARALLDSGSTSCLMTEEMSRKLNLSINRVDKSILGINNTSSRIGQMCRVQMKSLNDSFLTMLQCYVLPSITDEVPCRQVDISGINIPNDLCLADPNFYAPSSIDLIIGADVFWDILGLQHIKLGEGKPVLQETKLGWIVSGPLDNDIDDTSIQCNFLHIDDDIQNLLPRFRQLEKVSPQSSEYSTEEKLYEEHLVKNTTRQDDGRFSVRIPLKESPHLLGNSINKAKHCLFSFKSRLKSQPNLSKIYEDYMSDSYDSLNHMSEYRNTDIKVNGVRNLINH